MIERVLQVVASTCPDQGGVARSVPSLCESLSRNGVEVHLLTSAYSETPDAAPVLPNGEVHNHVIRKGGRFSRLVRSPHLFYRRMNRLVSRIQPDIIHDHGAWLPSNIVAARIARKFNIPLVTSPRGMMSSWAWNNRPWKKRAAWTLYQQKTLGIAAMIHATSLAEAEDLKSLGVRQPVSVIPNGVERPSVDFEPGTSDRNENCALFLSRLHPKKGLDMLLDAWSRVDAEGWELKIVGPSKNGYRRQLKDRAEELGLGRTVTFEAEVNDRQKWEKYRTADLFILPSYSENFGIVVAEAMAAGVPVITTKGTPWQELKTHRCGWWTDISTEAVAGALREALSTDREELRKMGQRGRKLACRRYSWSEIGRRMLEAYKLVGSRKPETGRRTADLFHDN